MALIWCKVSLPTAILPNLPMQKKFTVINGVSQYSFLGQKVVSWNEICDAGTKLSLTPPVKISERRLWIAYLQINFLENILSFEKLESPAHEK